MKPAPRLARIDDEDSVIPSNFGLVGMSIDENVAGSGPNGFPNVRVQMKDAKSPAALLESQGGRDDFSLSFQDRDQRFFFSIAVAENGLDRTAKLPKLGGRERSDEIPGMNDQAARHIVEKPDGAADGGQIVVGIRNDPDHALILFLSAGKVHPCRLHHLALAFYFCYTYSLFFDN